MDTVEKLKLELINEKGWSKAQYDERCKIQSALEAAIVRAEAAEHQVDVYQKEMVIQLNRAEAAEKRVEEERIAGMKWFDDFTYTGAKLEDAEKRVAVLRAQLVNSDRWRAQGNERELELMKRVAELEEVLAKMFARMHHEGVTEYHIDCQCSYCKAYRTLENKWKR